ncbi:MAG: hypothetical protein C5B52_17140 [Bacteroidetes bacterium]|nr:MAG: hypothetical protein C5B52_17140 [Bacteroidota bacterium]
MMFKRAFNFFIYSSIFVSLCAVIMVAQTNILFHLEYEKFPFFFFVFCSTLCSYNFHWWLTPYAPNGSMRNEWNQGNRILMVFFCILGLIGAAYTGWGLRNHWMALGIGVFATFLYTAPKIPYGAFRKLSKIAVGKTIFLSFVWMYVTTALPILVSDANFNFAHLLFCSSRFFLIFAICILFDYKDREEDRRQGIVSMVTRFSDQNIMKLYLLTVLIFGLSSAALYFYDIPFLDVITILLAIIPLLGLKNYARTHFGDYLYYFVLDGLMMASALITVFIRI